MNVTNRRQSSSHPSSTHGNHSEIHSQSSNWKNDIEDIEDGRDHNGQTYEFQYSHHGLTTYEALQLLKKYGKNELPEKRVSKLAIFCGLLLEPMPVMIWLAILIESILGQWMDSGILFGIQMTNASIAFYETSKSSDAVAALKASLKPLATVKRDGKWQRIDSSELVPGDLVSLGNGSAIPADVRINDGTIDVDQAALTGESLPVTKCKGDTCQMGSTVSRGETEATVEFTGSKTFFGRTASLLGPDNEQSNLQNMLMDIMIVLVIISFTLCAIVYLHLSSITSITEGLSFTVVLMVASIPLAIEIVTTTTLSLGSKELVKHGAIVTRLSAIEDMAGMSILCSDKTGTLTMNKMQLQEECPIYVPSETQYTLLRYAAMATKWWEPPKDALDTLTLAAADISSLQHIEQLDYMPFDPTVKRTEGTILDKTTGHNFKVSKGAPHVILELVNDKSITQRVEDDILHLGQRGIRSLAIAKTDPNTNQWRMLGILTFLDPPREDTLATIHAAYECGVSVKMVTGDHLLIAKETSRILDLGTNILSPHVLPSLDPTTGQKPSGLAATYGSTILHADGFAEVFPEHKYLIVETLRELGLKIGMTGDGVNDAPALKRADVGVAVQGATDAACAAADIVLTQPGLNTIIEGILIARCIFVRIRNFITYRIAATLQLLLFFFIAIFAFQPSEYEPSSHPSILDHHFSHGQLTFNDLQYSAQLGLHGSDVAVDSWPNFFHMPVSMLMLITLLNDGTLIAIGYDNVDSPKAPTQWNLRVLFVLGFVLAIVACVSSLFLLQLLLSSWTVDSWLSAFGLAKIQYPQITTAIFLKVAISDFLTLFSSRAGEDWFWASRPAPILLMAACLALSLSTLFACYWPNSSPDGIPTGGLLMSSNSGVGLVFFIWMYCLVWWFIQDAMKVWVCQMMKKTNLFGYNDTTASSLLRQKSLSAIRSANSLSAMSSTPPVSNSPPVMSGHDNQFSSGPYLRTTLPSVPEMLGYQMPSASTTGGYAPAPSGLHLSGGSSFGYSHNFTSTTSGESPLPSPYNLSRGFSLQKSSSSYPVDIPPSFSSFSSQTGSAAATFSNAVSTLGFSAAESWRRTTGGGSAFNKDV